MCQFVGRARSGAKVNVIFEKNSWMEAAVEFKKRVAGGGIFGIDVCKLSHYQEACPVYQFSVYKSSEICLQYAVLSLYLAIGLRIKSHRESSFDF